MEGGTADRLYAAGTRAFRFPAPAEAQRYEQHPDPNQEALVYSLLADLVDRGEVSKQELVAEMAANHVRHDSLDLVDRYRGWNGLAEVA